uniref:Tubulin polyglutamylase TTLL5 n=1 Tax=Mesocestoides corti TaxID=53468 RepID=A0A5K3F897_MESCO
MDNQTSNPASARGIGVHLVNKFAEISKRKKSIAQAYISEPYLINGHKFDLRLYVYASSVDPLRLYIHKNGLVRFASQKYSNLQLHVANRFVHLTNYSVNKRNSNYLQCNSSAEKESHKWPLQVLWRYLEKEGHDTAKLWTSIKYIVFKTMASAVAKMASLVLHNVARRESVHELFGFDILIDSHLRPWLLEVNISPSLHTSSQLDNTIKSEVVVDMFNLAGFRVPPKSVRGEPKHRTNTFNQSRKQPNETGNGTTAFGDVSNPSNTVEVEEEQMPIHRAEQLRYNLTEMERMKHRLFTVRAQSLTDMKTILDNPTTDDVLMLANTLNEWYRASLGHFERIFPQHGPESSRLITFIDSMGCDGLNFGPGRLGSPRYYDVLLHQFLEKYGTSVQEDESGSTKLDAFFRQESPQTQCKTRDQTLSQLSKKLGVSVDGINFVAKLADEYLPKIASANPYSLPDDTLNPGLRSSVPTPTSVTPSNPPKAYPSLSASSSLSGRPPMPPKPLPPPLPKVREPASKKASRKPLKSSTWIARPHIDSSIPQTTTTIDDILMKEEEKEAEIGEFMLNWHNL